MTNPEQDKNPNDGLPEVSAMGTKALNHPEIDPRFDPHGFPELGSIHDLYFSSEFVSHEISAAMDERGGFPPELFTAAGLEADAGFAALVTKLYERTSDGQDFVMSTEDYIAFLSANVEAQRAKQEAYDASGEADRATTEYIQALEHSDLPSYLTERARVRLPGVRILLDDGFDTIVHAAGAHVEKIRGRSVVRMAPSFEEDDESVSHELLHTLEGSNQWHKSGLLTLFPDYPNVSQTLNEAWQEHCNQHVMTGRPLEDIAIHPTDRYVKYGTNRDLLATVRGSGDETIPIEHFIDASYLDGPEHDEAIEHLRDEIAAHLTPDQLTRLEAACKKRLEGEPDDDAGIRAIVDEMQS